MGQADLLALRQLALAVSVLNDIDLTPADDGVILTGPPMLHVSWHELRLALGGADAQDDLARIRVTSWLRGRTIGATRSAEDLRGRVRPVGLPLDHVLHPGRAWVRRRVHGGALELGVGFLGVGPDPDVVVVVPHEALLAGGINAVPWWPIALHYLEKMGRVAADRLVRSKLLRPMGDCDVVTLLGARSFRAALAAGDPTGMRAASVPMRRRGWLDPSRIDPAFTAAAAAATEPLARGFPRPLLVTPDEVVLAPKGGRPAEIVLRDRALPRPPLTQIRFH